MYTNTEGGVAGEETGISFGFKGHLTDAEFSMKSIKLITHGLQHFVMITFSQIVLTGRSSHMRYTACVAKRPKTENLLVVEICECL